MCVCVRARSRVSVCCRWRAGCRFCVLCICVCFVWCVLAVPFILDAIVHLSVIYIDIYDILRIYICVSHVLGASPEGQNKQEQQGHSSSGGICANFFSHVVFFGVLLSVL